MPQLRPGAAKMKEGRREEGKEGRKEGREEGKNCGFKAHVLFIVLGKLLDLLSCRIAVCHD